MPPSLSSPAFLRLVVSILLPCAAAACSASDAPREAGSSESLGVVSFATSCDRSVQRDFDRAVALLHHMTYPRAAEAFRDIAKRDPECGIAYWGEAMTLFQPLWPTRPSADDLERGQALSRQALANVEPGSREARFVDATAAFFDPSGEADYWDRIERWAAATTVGYEADPSDLEASAFYGLSQLATSARSADPADQNRRAAEVFAGILAEEPDHPGAVHYTIHANDFDGRQGESLDVVRNYASIAPANPHALHMPTHIFVRLGAWPEVIDWNERAAEAALGERVGPSGEYVWDEFPHAVEYLVYAHLQRGDDDVARELIDRLAATPNLQPSFKTAFHLASTASRYALERQDWEAAAAVSVRQPADLAWDRFPWPEAVAWHARGLGAAHLGRQADVTASLAQLTSLGARAEEMGESLFATQIAILELEVRAWQAFEVGASGLAVALLEEAVLLEARTPKHPVTPGATLPAGELLGDLYLALGDHASAYGAYATSNRRIPGRLNTLLGLARSSTLGDDPVAARAFYEEITERTVGSAQRDGVVEAREAIAG